MRTKTFSAKRLLSLLLTVAMFATMILPTNVFASTVPVAVASAVDNGDGTITRKITISFYEEIDATDALLGSTVYVYGKAEAFGTTGSSLDPDPNGEDIVITVGENYTAVIGDKITFDTDCIKYVSDDSYFNGDVEITGSFDVPLADFTALNDAITDAEAVVKANFTPATVAPFEAALATAKAIDTATETNQTKVNDATFALENAIANLLALANFTELNEAIADAEAIVKANYTVSTVSAFETALATAKGIDQATTSVNDQDIVDDAVDALEDAMNNLVPLANFTALNEAIEQAGHVDSNDYTAASYAVLTAAVTAANSIDQTEESVQANVDNAKDAILTAIAGLVGFTDITFTATAVADDVTVNYAKANKIIVVFGNPLKDGAEAILADKINVDATVSKVNNSVYVLELDATHTLTNGITLEIEPDEEIFAADGKAINACSATVVGNLESAAELVTADEMTATIVNVDDKPYMVNGDKIVLVFNAPVYGNPATITVSGMEFAVVANTDNTVYERVLDATSDSVLAGQELAYGDIKATLKGTFGGTVIPVVVRALVEDADGTAKTVNDKINVFFNAPTNKTAGTVENAFVDVLAGATGKWFDNQTLVITLGETPITINDKIDLSNLGIKDFYGKKEVEAIDIELEGSFGTAIQPALLTLTAISKQGKGAPSAGDEIYLAFNVKMREDALNLKNDFTFNYGDYGTGASVAWATGDEYAEYSTIIITLGEGANVVPGTTKITIDKELFEESGFKSCEVNNLENRYVTGTFGTSIAPSLISASIVKRSTEVGSQPGDQIVLLFNVPTNAADIINLISVAGGDLGNNVEEGVWSNNNTIYTITLGDGASIANDSSIAFTNTNGVLKDINNQKVASTKTLDLNGSFGVEADEVGISPSSVTATIVKTTTDAGAQAGDKIVFAFNVATNGVDLVNYFKSKGIYGNTGLAGGWSNGNTVYTLVLGDGATVTDTSVAEFTVEAGIKDKNEINGAVTLTAGTFIGSFGATITPSSVAPEVLSATIVKGDGNTSGAAQAGDKIVIAFNMATNKADLFNTLGGTALFGTGVVEPGKWNEDGNIYTVTLGENATVTDDTVLTISESAGLKDKQEYSAAAEDDHIELIGSFGVEVIPVAPKPALKKATIIKDSGMLGIHAGDKIVLTFNVATNGFDLLNTIDFAGRDGETLGTGASGRWISDIEYEIELGVGAKISEDAEQTAIMQFIHHGNLKDKMGITAADDIVVVEFVGSFGVAPELKLEKAIIVKGENNTVAKAQKGDMIILSFSSKTNAADIKANLGAEYGKDENGTPNASGAWSNDDTVYTITLGDNPTIADATNFSIPENTGLAGVDGGVFASNAVPFEGSFGKVNTPSVISAVAYSDVDNDYIDIIFNIDTDPYIEDQEQGKYIFASSTIASGVLGDYSINWSKGPNVLTIILGNNHNFKKNSEITFANGLIMDADRLGKLADGTKVSGVKGELRKPYVTSVVANYDEGTGVETLTVTFSSKTNKPENIDLSAQSSSLGIGATASWTDTKTLVITLGAGRTISVNGTGGILLNGLGITNGFDTNEVVGQYSITAGTLKEDNLRVVDARVNRRTNDSNVTEDFLTVSFNAPTNMYGKVLNTEFNVNDIEANIVASKTFGAGATAKWESASRLVIKLGADSTFKNANDTNLAADSKVTFKNLKFANGLGAIVEEEFVVTGSFDGREVKLNNIAVATANEYTTATVTVDKQEFNYSDDAIVTFVIWDATKTTVTDMNAVKLNMVAVDTIEVSSKFAAKDYSKVEVYVTDAYIDAIDENTTFDVLATTVTANKAQ